MKQAALNLIRVSGAFAMLRLLNRHSALILTYHRFCHKNDGAGTPASAFSEQLAYLRSHYHIVPLSEIVEQLSSRGELRPGLAAITIDDGYRDAYEIAYPLLRRYRMPATLYVVTEFIERRAWLWTDKMRFITGLARPQELLTTINGREFRLLLTDERSRRAASEKTNSELKNLSDEAKEVSIKRIGSSLGVRIPDSPPEEYSAISWEQAREMDVNGVEIGSHTATHPILTNIGDERLQQELNESRIYLETVLKRRVDHFCYPNGDFDERVKNEVMRAGYKSSVTVVNGLNANGEDLLTLRRIHTEHDLTHFIQSTSGFELLKDRVRSAMR